MPSGRRSDRALFPGEPPKKRGQKERIGGSQDIEDSHLRQNGYSGLQTTLLAMNSSLDLWPIEQREEFFGEEAVPLENCLAANLYGHSIGTVSVFAPRDSKVTFPHRHIFYDKDGKLQIR